MEAGLIVKLPDRMQGVLPRSEHGLGYVASSEVRGVSRATNRLRLSVRDGVELGVAVIERRVVGYMDIHPEAAAGPAVIASSARGADAFALFGASIVSIGEFSPCPEGGVLFEGSSVPRVELTRLAAHFESSTDLMPASNPRGALA